MIILSCYIVDGHVAWQLYKVNPSHQWRARGPRAWERRGEVVLEDEALNDRQALRAALQAVLDRLGEREHLDDGRA